MLMMQAVALAIAVAGLRNISNMFIAYKQSVEFKFRTYQRRFGSAWRPAERRGANGRGAARWQFITGIASAPRF